jgi:hypothetical protein
VWAKTCKFNLKVSSQAGSSCLEFHARALPLFVNHRDSCPGPTTIPSDAYNKIALTNVAPYPNAMRCQVIISAGNGTAVALDFTAAGIEPGRDTLVVYDGMGTSSANIISAFTTAAQLLGQRVASSSGGFKSHVVVWAGDAGCVDSEVVLTTCKVTQVGASPRVHASVWVILVVTTTACGTK